MGRHSRSFLVLSFLVAVVIVAGCSGTPSAQTPPATAMPFPRTQTPASTPATTPAPTPAPTPSPVPTPTAQPKPKPVPSTLIDVHCHLNPSLCDGGLCGVDLLVSNMDKAGIGKTILSWLNYGASDSEDVLAAYRKYPDHIIPCRGDDGLYLNDPATLNLIRADLDTGLFRALGELRTRAHDNVNIPTDHPVLLGLFELGHKYSAPVTLHVQYPEKWLPEFERVLNQCPATTFIWAHCGPSDPDVLKGMFVRHLNLYADLSGLCPVWQKAAGYAPFKQQIDRPEWIRLMEAYPDRFLFGTDCMSFKTYVEYLAVVAWYRDNVFSRLSAETVEAIAHGNAERLFGIAPSAGAEKKPSVKVPSPRPERKMVSVTLGQTNTEDGLRQLRGPGAGLLQRGPGPTKVASLAGRPCRLMVSNGYPTRFMYFNIQNDFIYAKATKVIVTVDYFDAGTGWFRMDYDSSDFTLEREGSFKKTEPIRLRNSGTWQTATFHLSDAYFGDRQHHEVSDFRIAGPDQDLAISRVTVSR